jgi:hypothetical protein
MKIILCSNVETILLNQLFKKEVSKKLFRTNYLINAKSKMIYSKDVEELSLTNAKVNKNKIMLENRETW